MKIVFHVENTNKWTRRMRFLRRPVGLTGAGTPGAAHSFNIDEVTDLKNMVRELRDMQKNGIKITIETDLPTIEQAPSVPVLNATEKAARDPGRLLRELQREAGVSAPNGVQPPPPEVAPAGFVAPPPEPAMQSAPDQIFNAPSSEAPKKPRRTRKSTAKKSTAKKSAASKAAPKPPAPDIQV